MDVVYYFCGSFCVSWLIGFVLALITDRKDTCRCKKPTPGIYKNYCGVCDKPIKEEVIK